MNLLNNLSRVTSPSRTFIPQIDGLRFVPLMAVIAYHIRGLVADHFGISVDSPAEKQDVVCVLFGVGTLAVQMFFVISGFVLAQPFAKQHLLHAKPVNLREYYFRRLTRIEPPYVIHLIFLFFLSWLVLRRLPQLHEIYHNANWLSYVLHHLFASLFYVNGIIYGQHPFPNIVLWSLEVEVQFYLLSPLLARLFLIPNPALRRAIMVGLILSDSLCCHFLPLTYALRVSIVGNLQYFLTGYLFCDFYLGKKFASEKQNYQWDILALLACAAVLGFYTNRIFYDILFPWFGLIFCITAFKGRVTSKLLSWSWIVTIGGMCYTIYMYHWFIISFMLKLTRHLRTDFFWLDLPVQFVCITTGIVIISAFLFVLFERPFMQRDWHIKFWNALRAHKNRRAGG
jgi:peptidoglycan/LPS O-acetylase OafA/YrhL